MTSANLLRQPTGRLQRASPCPAKSHASWEETISTLVMSPHGWSVPCEPALADFIFERAVEFLAWKGIREACARVWFQGMTGMNEDRCAEWRHAAWDTSGAASAR